MDVKSIYIAKDLATKQIAEIQNTDSNAIEAINSFVSAYGDDPDFVDAVTKQIDDLNSKTIYDYAKAGGYTGTKEEFAERLIKEIPDPYTLPTATSDSKGGVVIGEGFVMEGDRLNTEVKKADINSLSEKKADKEYIVTLFEELKELIEAGNTAEAIALLDQAILDNVILA